MFITESAKYASKVNPKLHILADWLFLVSQKYIAVLEKALS